MGAPDLTGSTGNTDFGIRGMGGGMEDAPIGLWRVGLMAILGLSMLFEVGASTGFGFTGDGVSRSENALETEDLGERRLLLR